MRVAVVYNAPAANAGAAETDVLEQANAVATALRELSHEPVMVPCTLDLAALDGALARERPDVVFNLVEALGGADRLMTLVPLLLDARSIPYTGTGASALALSNDKVAAKTRMRALGLRTPDWFVPDAGQVAEPGCFIVKARHEHASVGMDDSAVVTVCCADELAVHIEHRRTAFGTEFFAERFVRGREFNLALIGAGAGDVDVLPPAEIDFSAFAPDKPHIVGYDAKWNSDSFEYHATPRRFEFPPGDARLLGQLRQTALDTWKCLELRGYARVDFRVDTDGLAWILEVNPNPCIAPDAGYAAALAAGGIEFSTAVARMLACAATH